MPTAATRKAPITKPLAKKRKVAKPTPAPLPRLLYTVTEAAQVLGYGYKKVRRLVMAGDIRSIKDGRYRMIPHHCLQEYIDGLLSMAG